MDQSYFSILVFMAIGVGLGVVALLAGFIFRASYPDAAKNSPYECGFDALENAHFPFNVRFYLVALLFLVFDLETAFFFPWAVILRHLSWTAFWAMMVFLAVLLVGFAYEWRRGALEWE